MGFGSRGVTKLDYAKMLAGCLTYLVHRQRDRVGLVAFDSDIVAHVPPSAKHMDVVLEAVGPLRFRGSDIIVFHLLDPAELDFTFDAPSSFEDLETGEQIPVVPAALADQYRTLVRAHIDGLTERFSGSRIDYTLVNTSAPLDHALFSYLSARERLTRVR